MGEMDYMDSDPRTAPAPHVHVVSRTALICNRAPCRVKLGFSIILRDPPISSRLRGATEDVVPHTWRVLKCRAVWAGYAYGHSTTTTGQLCLPLQSELR